MFSPFLSENLASFHIKVKKGRLRSARPMTMLSGGPLLIRTPYQAGVEYDRISFLNAGQSAQTECTKTVSHLFYERTAYLPRLRSGPVGRTDLTEDIASCWCLVP